MKRRIITTLLALGTSAALLAGCGDKTPSESDSQPSESTDAPEESPQSPAEVHMWDGYYFDDSTGRNCFIRLNEDGTYYAKYFGGSVLEAGEWQLLDEEMAYSIDGGADGDMGTFDDNTTETAPQTLVLLSYKGGEQRIAYNNDALNDMSFAGLANHRTASHVPDYPYNPAVDETPIQIFLFYANNDIGANLILSHDKTFYDLTGDAYQEGTWVMTGEGVYELTYSDGATGVLTVEGSGKNAELVSADGTGTPLRDDYKPAEEGVLKMISMRAEEVTVPELPMKVAVRLDAFGDDTCQLVMEVAQANAEILLDQGTWEISPAMKPAFHFETAGDLEGSPDYSSATDSSLNLTLSYAAETSGEFNGDVSSYTLDVELSGTYYVNGIGADGAAKVINTLTAEDAQVGLPMGVLLRIDCYDDGSCQLIVEIAQIEASLVADQGTYEINEQKKYIFTFDKGGEITSVPDYANASAETGMDMTLTYTADTEVEFNGTVTPLSINSELLGHVDP